MSSTVAATFAGSSASSQPCGLPVSTAQKRQARVHTLPMTMMVAVPAFQHSPMLGHLASSHTVARRCSRTTARTDSKPLPAASGARNQEGLPASPRRSAPSRARCPSLMAVKPCGVRYFSQLRGGCETSGMSLNSATFGTFAMAGVESLQALRRAYVNPAPIIALTVQTTLGDCRAQQRQQRESPGITAGEQLRPIDANAGVGQP